MAGGGIELPAPAIERVQSFLSSKEATRTTGLSKSWRGAWLTRPNLDFDQGDFGGINCSEESWNSFIKFGNRTVKRYENSNLKIRSFRLCMKRPSQRRYKHFTGRALKIGAAHDLSIQLEGSSQTGAPVDVFASENLAALTVKGCAMDLRQLNVIRCSRLRSLCLEHVKIDGRHAISNIILSCPLIEKFSLCHVSYVGDRLTPSGDVLGDGLGLANLRSLRSLVLMGVHLDTLNLGDLLSNFPFLKDLTLCECFTKKDELLISSHSLESLYLTNDVLRLRVMDFDVPSIRKFKFTYRGYHLPSISFRSTSRRWESHVSITHDSCSFNASWFLSLSNFLSGLSSSRIYLSVHLYTRMSFDYMAGEIQGLPTRVIEDLTIDLQNMPSLSWYAVWDGLFRMCRPKFILPKYTIQSSSVDFLGQTLLQGLTEKVSNPSRFMYGLNDLKEARGQIFDEVASMWRDVPLESLLDHDSTTHPEVRFELKWQLHV